MTFGEVDDGEDFIYDGIVWTKRKYVAVNYNAVQRHDVDKAALFPEDFEVLSAPVWSD